MTHNPLLLPSFLWRVTSSYESQLVAIKPKKHWECHPVLWGKCRLAGCAAGTSLEKF